MGCLARSIGHSISAAMPRFVQRCLRIIQEGCRAGLLWDQNPNEFERPNRDLICVSVGILSGILDGLGENAKDLLAQQNFLLVVPEVLKDSGPRVKHSGFALVATCAKNYPAPLIPLLSELLPLCATALASPSPLACNGASWAIGEITMKVGAQTMGPYVDGLVQALVGALTGRTTATVKPWSRIAEHQLKPNICITLGRLGVVCGASMGKYLPSFLSPWCVVMRNYRLDNDKILAFQGLCTMIRANAMAPVDCFVEFACAVASFAPPPPELEPTFRELMLGYRQALAAQWPAMYSRFPEDLKGKMKRLYGLTA